MFFVFSQSHEFDECRFDVSVNNCVWYLRCETPEDKRNWVEVLQSYNVSDCVIFLFLNYRSLVDAINYFYNRQVQYLAVSMVSTTLRLADTTAQFRCSRTHCQRRATAVSSGQRGVCARKYSRSRRLMIFCRGKWRRCNSKYWRINNVDWFNFYIFLIHVCAFF